MSQAQKPAITLAQAPQAIASTFRHASGPKKVAMVAAGAALLATAPYWAPALWRSKSVRRLAAAGASFVVPRVLG